jgi:hypothetical protein
MLAKGNLFAKPERYAYYVRQVIGSLRAKFSFFNNKIRHAEYADNIKK